MHLRGAGRRGVPMSEDILTHGHTSRERGEGRGANGKDINGR